MQTNISVIERDGKVMLLAYDQGFEHGPVDLDERNVNPEYIIGLLESKLFTGVVFQEGVADKYYDVKKHKTPLIVKLNGKTSYQKGMEPLSLQLCTVERAVELGAKGVGYTIYVGSEHEEQMMVEFSKIEDEAHKAGLVVIAWMYPRGEKVKGKETEKETVAYAARLGMELNADFVKVPYTGSKESFKWVVKCAGKTGVLVQGGNRVGWEKLEKQIVNSMDAGAKGIAIGRNVWQAEKPLEVAEKLSKLVY